MIKNYKQIAVSNETYRKLKEHGEFGESFDDVINKLLERKRGSGTN